MLGRFISLVFVFISVSAFLFGQKGTLEGVILELGGSVPVPGVRVSISGTDFRTITKTDGSFKISNVPFGNYEINFESFGYNSLREQVEIDDELMLLTVRMEELISDLPGVTIVAGGRAGVSKIPGSVHYLSSKDLDRFSYTDINRTLRNVPGVNYREEDGFGLRPNIGMRGTGLERSNKITVMEDGVLAAPAPYSAPAAYYFPNIGRMSGLEAVMGSSAIEHGPYTTGGALNFLSTPIPNEFSGKLNMTMGRFNTYNVHAVVGNSHKNVAYMVEALTFGSDGFKNLDGGGNTGFDRKDFQAKVRVNTDKDAKIYQSLTLKAGYADETSDDTYLGLTKADYDMDPYRRYVGSSADLMNTEHMQLSLTHNAKLTKNMNLTTVAYRNEFSRNWYKLQSIQDSLGDNLSMSEVLDNPETSDGAYEFVTGDLDSPYGGLQVRANNRTYVAQGVQTRFNYKFGSNVHKHKIQASVRYHEDEEDRYQWTDKYSVVGGAMQLVETGTPGTQDNRIERAEALASFIKYQYEWKQFTLTTGLRHELITMSRRNYGTADLDRTGVNLTERSNELNVLIPGAGLNYKYNEHLNFFGGVHRGFSPSGSNPNTNPEFSVNYELGTRYDRRALSIQGTTFYNDYTNLLGSDLAASGAVGTGNLFNGGAARAMGAEVFVKYDVLRFFTPNTKFSLPITLNYTYTDAVFLSDFDSEFGEWGEVERDFQMPYIAPHQLGFNLGVEHEVFSFNLGGRYMGKMRTVPGKGEYTEGEFLNDYIIMDVSAAYHMHKNISLFGTATNILNKAYAVALRPAGYRPGMPFAFQLGVKARF